MKIERLEILVGNPDQAYITVDGRTYEVSVNDYLALNVGVHITPYELRSLVDKDAGQ